MYYPKAEYVFQIREEQRQLHRDLIRGGITVEEYLGRDHEIDELYAGVGEVCESFEQLERRLRIFMDSEYVRNNIDIARKYAALGEIHGMGLRIVYIKYDDSSLVPLDRPEYGSQNVVRNQLIHDTPEGIIYQYPNFGEKAKNWKLRQIIEFNEKVDKLSDSSDSDETNG
ncbi:MAG: hypothetical protein IH934_03790 [Nanoarchaeota archaeon]|nr:hypothetical protein [Nanoarchaeota archaeon]